MWHNVWAVIRREYLQRVRSKWFVIATIGGPLLMGGLTALPIILAVNDQETERRIAIVDGTNVLYDEVAPELEEAGWDVHEVRWNTEIVTELRDSAEAGVLGGFIMMDEITLESGEAIFYASERPSSLRRFTMQNAITRSALEYQLGQQGVDASAMLSGGDLRIEMLSEDGTGDDDPQFLVAYMGAMFLYFVILIYAVAVMRATLEEKTNRIVEVIVSAMKPWHLMLGKIVGVGAVSMTQMAVWVGFGVLIFAMGLPRLIAMQPELSDLSRLQEVLPDLGMVALFLGLFVFGFFMYSGLYAAVGAMCSTDEEAQQAQFPLIMLLVIPIMFIIPAIESPNSSFATGMSLFPLFTPILLWSRVAGGGVPGWQIAAGFAGMILATLAIAWLAGRIYKVGILMAGKRPTLPELVRWIREA